MPAAGWKTSNFNYYWAPYSSRKYRKMRKALDCKATYFYILAIYFYQNIMININTKWTSSVGSHCLPDILIYMLISLYYFCLPHSKLDFLLLNHQVTNVLDFQRFEKPDVLPSYAIKQIIFSTEKRILILNEHQSNRWEIIKKTKQNKKLDKKKTCQQWF